MFSDYHDEYIHEDDAIYLEAKDGYVRFDETVELDIPNGIDTRALECETKTVQLKREVVVHEDDDSIPEALIADAVAYEPASTTRAALAVAA